MNPDTNRFERLREEENYDPLDPDAIQDTMNKGLLAKLYRPDGSLVPDHWSIYQAGEKVVIRNYTFEVAYIGETYMVLEPVGPVILGESEK